MALRLGSGEAIRGRGAAYDVRPAGESGLGFAGPFAGLMGFAKDSVQGSCSGLLALLGASHMSGAPGGFATISSDVGTLGAFWQSLSATGLAGPVELLAGIVLFFAARRTIARTLGLLAFVGFIAAYANGYNTSDMLGVLASLLEGAAGALQSIPVAESA